MGWDELPKYFRAFAKLAGAAVIASSFYASGLEAEENNLNIRELLKKDFGLDVNIAGGIGHRNDPIVIRDTNTALAALTEMEVLKGLGRGRGVLWRTLSKELVEKDTHLVQQVKVETKHVKNNEVVTQTEAYYFDISASGQRSEALPDTVAVLPDGQMLPYEFAWLHYQGVINNEPENPGMGVSVAYGAPGTKATIYLYDKGIRGIPADINSPVVRSEFKEVQADVLKVNPSADPLGPERAGKKFHFQSFRVNGEISLVGVGAYRGKFVKVRLTHLDDSVLSEAAAQSLSAIEAFFSH